jgi:hypothetical protein
MDYDAEYRNLFTEGSCKIMIRPWLAIQCIGAVLNIDSYVNPNNAVLLIEENNNEDIVFNGLIEVNDGITEYGNITCKHIIFGFNSVCIISKLNVSSIQANSYKKIIYSVNEHIMAFNCCGSVNNKNIGQYFPNLIINFNYGAFNSDGLMWLMESESEFVSVIVNMQHEHGHSFIESDIPPRDYKSFGSVAMFDTDIDDMIPYQLAVFLMRVTSFIKEQESKARLFKNANN